jgi:hypothetical protein
MSTGEWDVARAAGACARCGRAFREGDEHYSVLIDEKTAFVRRDLCPECRPKEPAAQAGVYWKTRVPRKDARKKTFVDDDVIINFFERCGGETEPLRLNFRFVLALVLMRKRLLKYENTVTEDGQEFWLMKLAGSDEPVKVLNPRLTEEQIAQVSEELGKILNSEV